MTASQVVRSHPDGAALTVWVVPGARQSEIVGFHGDAVKIRIAAPPERGRANKALIDLLSEHFGAQVRLASGAGSRRKRFVVSGMSVSDLVECVDRLID
jgi:uncharacterized protein (TIGR00251 family)